MDRFKGKGGHPLALGFVKTVRGGGIRLLFHKWFTLLMRVDFEAMERLCKLLNCGAGELFEIFEEVDE